jgi:hypothetical protein
MTPGSVFVLMTVVTGVGTINTQTTIEEKPLA